LLMSWPLIEVGFRTLVCGGLVCELK
jgi:hypothetical protein